MTKQHMLEIIFTSIFKYHPHRCKCHINFNTNPPSLNLLFFSTYFPLCPISFKLLPLLLGIPHMQKELHCAYFPFIVIVFFFHIFLHRFSFTHLLEASLSSFFNKPSQSSNCVAPI